MTPSASRASAHLNLGPPVIPDSGSVESSGPEGLRGVLRRAVAEVLPRRVRAAQETASEPLRPAEHRELARVVLVETADAWAADPRGQRIGHPGLATWATAARHSRDPGLLGAHCQPLPGGLRVIAAPVGAVPAHAALTMGHRGGGGDLLHAAADPDTLVLLDAGRIEPYSLTVRLLPAASAVLIVTRSRADEVAHAAMLVAVVPRWTARPGLVLLGPGHPTAEVHAQLGCRCWRCCPPIPAARRCCPGGPPATACAAPRWDRPRPGSPACCITRPGPLPPPRAWKHRLPPRQGSPPFGASGEATTPVPFLHHTDQNGLPS